MYDTWPLLRLVLFLGEEVTVHNTDISQFLSTSVLIVLTLSYTDFFGLAGHGGDGIHHTFITLVLFDGFELNLVR